eukprot:3401603-Rhodomonas_salina.1
MNAGFPVWISGHGVTNAITIISNTNTITSITISKALKVSKPKRTGIPGYGRTRARVWPIGEAFGLTGHWQVAIHTIS